METLPLRVKNKRTTHKKIYIKDGDKYSDHVQETRRNQPVVIFEFSWEMKGIFIISI